MGQHPADPEHMPDAHRGYAGRGGERFRRWAAEKGPSTERVVDAALRPGAVERRSCRSCRALPGPGRRHGDAVPGEACAKALGHGRGPSYKTARAMAAKLAADRPSDPDEHACLRGSGHCGGNRG